MTDSTGEWEVIGRPYTTAGGKNSHVRVQRVDQARRDGNRLLGVLREGHCDTARDRRGGQAVMRLLQASVVVLSLITSAATAHAECAWVLWTESTSIGGAQRYTRGWQV